MKDTWNKVELAKAYYKCVVKLHGVPKDIELLSAMGTTLKMSTAFHPATDGKTEQIIQTLEDMLRACEMVEQVHIIRQKMRAAQDRQKSYADLKRSDMEFSVGDKVLLKVSPMKGVMRFRKRGKLSQKYIGPYEVTDRVGEEAYRLALPPALARVHNVFHVS
ncbi:uncharacterized protein LOC141620540 [Silene latifolia]|uniref:uncharacterized protein LOC141620540 n=1 Tax=Silene latifolia TaxID=37657 RepID=UPI003D772601